MKAFLTWASSVVFLVLLVAVLYAYAHKQLAGFPDEPEKNVSLIPSSAPPGDVALLLQPPMATRQMQGQSQILALQFSNKAQKRVEILPVRVEPRECFALQPLNADPTVLEGLATTVKLDRLSFPEGKKCVGESPLIFIYSWKVLPDPVGSSVTRKGGAKRSAAVGRKETDTSAVQERSIATTPIRITNEALYSNERFVSIGRLVLIPVLLAIVTFIFQRLQAARDEAQSEETLKIEVWKIIHPTFLSMVKKYYAPLARRMGAIIGLIENNGNQEDELVLLLLLRRQLLLLLDQDAGYYFQSKPGEEICGILNDALVHLWRTHHGQDFDDAALLLSGGETAQDAKRLLVAIPIQLSTMATTLFSPSLEYPDPASFINHTLKLFVTVLAFESDRPFYSVWYETKFPPKIRFDDLPRDLSWLQASYQQAMEAALNEYRTSIPWRCVSDKSICIRLERILKIRP
jgi:hypothetical protein